MPFLWVKKGGTIRENSSLTARTKGGKSDLQGHLSEDI